MVDHHLAVLAPEEAFRHFDDVLDLALVHHARSAGGSRIAQQADAQHGISVCRWSWFRFRNKFGQARGFKELALEQFSVVSAATLTRLSFVGFVFPVSPAEIIPRTNPTFAANCI